MKIVILDGYTLNPGDPHISWAPKESRHRLMEIAVSNLAAFRDGSPVNVVNR